MLGSITHEEIVGGRKVVWGYRDRGRFGLNATWVCQAKPGRLGGGENISEISHWNPAGIQSRPAKCADSRNRVLRGGGATNVAKRTQGACRPCDGATKLF